MPVLVIDENKWLRAGRGGTVVDPEMSYAKIPKGKTKESRLNNTEVNRMCCLGFAARAAGVTKAQMGKCQLPSSLRREYRIKVQAMFPWLFTDKAAFVDSYACALLMDANDSQDLSLTERRNRIKEIFAENGWEVRFAK